MGSGIKPNWIQRGILKAIGLPNVVPQLSRFQNVVINMMGLQALWNTDSFESNVNAYTSTDTLYSITSRIMRSAGLPEFKVYRIKDKKKHLKVKSWTGENATYESVQRAMIIKALAYEEDSSHPFNKVLSRPNEWQRGNEFIIHSVGYKLLTGNRFIFVNKYEMGADKGRPFEMYNLPPQHMQIFSDGTPYGVKGYRFALGDREELRRDEIIHSKYFQPKFDNTGTHLLGLSPIQAARRNITRIDAAQNRGTASLQNAGAAGALVDKIGDKTIEQAQEVKAKLINDITGYNNVSKIAFLNGDYDFINFAMSAKDLETIATEKFSDQKLCVIYGFPPGLIDPDKSGEHNAQEFKKELITSAVLPELSSLRDDLNEIAKLYGDDIYVDFDISVYPELQEDMDKVAARLEKMPYLTWNEKRLAVGQDEDGNQPLMKEYFVPSGLTPLSQLVSDDEGIKRALQSMRDEDQ